MVAKKSMCSSVKHDIAKRWVADVNAKIDEVTIENEFNAELLI